MAIPVTIPLDMAMTAYFQLRMICVIAIIYGWDAKSDRLRTLVMALMLGSGASESVKVAATTVGKSSYKAAVKAIPRQAIVQFNRAVKPFVNTGRAVTKAGQKGLVNLSKAVPLVGGVTGASIDWGGRTSSVVAPIGCFAAGRGSARSQITTEVAEPAPPHLLSLRLPDGCCSRSMSEPPSNFAFLAAGSPKLARLGALAERYFANDAPAALVKLRQLNEFIAEDVAEVGRVEASPGGPMLVTLTSSSP